MAPELAEAIARHRSGDLPFAERRYLEHLRAHPEDVSALHFLGLLRTQQARMYEGIELMDEAVRLDPGYVDAWSNLAIAFHQQRDFERAEKCCRKAIALAPEFANAWANLGMALRARNLAEEALTAWQRALDLQPGLRNIAIAYGQLLYRLDRVGEAREFYARWLATDPGEPIAQHMLAAMGGAALPSRASDAYVRALFDDFAESFDAQLEKLDYRAPQLLLDAFQRQPPAGVPLRILDLGCGTGLCGALFRPHAARLVGVDLSPKMLAKAAARGLYEQLNLGELVAFLSGCPEDFDAALAADVLCYFGELGPVLKEVARVLCPGGRLVFSLEAMADEAATSAFTLQKHGRYQHREAYVRECLTAAGLQIAELGLQGLRYERSETVDGLVIVACKAGCRAPR